MTKFFSILLYLILIITLLAKEPKPQYFVDAKGGLHLREEPSEKSKSILLIPDKSGIQILKEVGDTVKLNEKSGHWTEIKFGNKNGFVFDAYIRKYFLLDKKFSPNKKLFYEYYTPASNSILPDHCVSDYDSGLEHECFIRIFKMNGLSSFKLLNYSDTFNPANRFLIGAWFYAKDWYDNKSFFIVADFSDGGYSFTSVGYMNIYSGIFTSLLTQESSSCENEENGSVELIKFNKVINYRITSENPKLQTGYFTMLKPRADDYNKLLETCKRDPKNSVLVKPTTIVRRNYTFKINSKKASLYFKGKDILREE